MLEGDKYHGKMTRPRGIGILGGVRSAFVRSGIRAKDERKEEKAGAGGWGVSAPG